MRLCPVRAEPLHAPALPVFTAPQFRMFKSIFRFPGSRRPVWSAAASATGWTLLAKVAPGPLLNAVARASGHLSAAASRSMRHVAVEA